MNEVCRGAHHASAGHRSPELLRVLKLFEDAQCPRNRDATIGITGRSVAHLAHTRVPGPSVVPTVGGFPRELGRYLDHLNSKSRIKPLEHHRHRRRHDPTTDKHYIGSVNYASHDTAEFSNCPSGAARGPSGFYSAKQGLGHWQFLEENSCVQANGLVVTREWLTIVSLSVSRLCHLC